MNSASISTANCRASAILDKGQQSVKGMNSGSEGFVTVDLILTVQKPSREIRKGPWLPDRRIHEPAGRLPSHKRAGSTGKRSSCGYGWRVCPSDRSGAGASTKVNEPRAAGSRQDSPILANWDWGRISHLKRSAAGEPMSYGQVICLELRSFVR